MTTDLIGFIDESRKPMRDRRTGRVLAAANHYVVAAGVVLAGDLQPIRLQLAKLETDLGFPLHYSDMSRERRRRVAQSVSAIGGWDGYLFETARPLPRRHYSEHFVRSKVVGAAFECLSSDVEVTVATLETRNHPSKGLYQLDEKDHQVLQSLVSEKRVASGFRITHTDKSERVLALADILAGARTDYLCGVDVEPFAILTHLVRRTVKVLER